MGDEGHLSYIVITAAAYYPDMKIARTSAVLVLTEFSHHYNNVRHNERDGISNHEPHDCLLNRLFKAQVKETSNLRVTGLCGGIHRWPVNNPHKEPVTRNMIWDAIAPIMTSL